MSTSRTSKLNAVASQLPNRKPQDCYVGGKVHKENSFDKILQEKIEQNEQIMVSAKRVKEWNNNMDEFLKAYPNNQAYKMLKKAFEDLGLREKRTITSGSL